MSKGQPNQMKISNQIVEKQLQEERNFIAAVLDTIAAIVVVLDPTGRIVRFNRACEVLTGYSSEEVIGSFLWDFLVPADQTELVKLIVEQLQTGQVPNQAENHWITKNGSRRLISWSNTTIPELDGMVKYLVGTGIDITDHRRADEALQRTHDELELRVAERTAELWEANEILREQIMERQRAEESLLESQRILERRVEERTRELSTLLEVSHEVASTLELRALLDLVLDELKAVIEYAGAAIFTLEGKDLTVLAYRGPGPMDEIMQIRFNTDQAPVNREVIIRREPVIIPDVQGDSSLARAFQETALRTAAKLREGEPEAIALATFGYIRNLMGVPLIVRERVIGMLTLDHETPGYYTPHQASLAMAFANQAAVAIENARLYREEQERRHESEQRRSVAEGLRDILAVINSNQPLNEVLQHIIAQATRLLGTDAGAIYFLQSDKNLLTIEAAQGLPTEYITELKVPVGQGAVGRAVVERQPVVVSTIPFAVPEPMVTGQRQQEHLAWLISSFQSLLAVPLVVRSEIYGGIMLYYRESRHFSPDELKLAVSIADQAALAIENARLRDQAEQTAVAAERSRLARDLHDAVTQTLFSASLIAEVLPRLWEKNRAEGQRRLEELRQLNRGALAEMRTLLLELRPSALVEVGLGDLLRQLAEATTGRSRIMVTVKVEGQGCSPAGRTQAGLLPPDVQIAMYRIAQEALNNVAKHSGASSATIELSCKTEQLEAEPSGLRSVPIVELCVVDNGRGFNTNSVSADHLGLRIMRERADSAGINLQLSSQMGHGTLVKASWHG